VTQKTKCSIKIKEEDKFVQPPIHIVKRQQSVGLSNFMSPA